MVSSKRIRVHQDFIDQLGIIARPVAEKIKKDFKLTKLDLDYPTMTELAAGKLSGKKTFNFRVHRISRDCGKLVLS